MGRLLQGAGALPPPLPLLRLPQLHTCTGHKRACPQSYLDDSLKVELGAIPQGELPTLSACDTASTLWRPGQ